MSQKGYKALPIVPYFDNHGRLIPDYPPEARAQLPLLHILRKESNHEPDTEPAGSIPSYPQVQWETTPTVYENDRPSNILSVTTKVSLAYLDNVDLDPVLGELPTVCQEQANILRTIGTELHEHQLTQCGLQDLRLAQNRDVHLLALKKLMKDEPLEDALFPEDVQDFAKRYYSQRRTCFS